MYSYLFHLASKENYVISQLHSYSYMHAIAMFQHTIDCHTVYLIDSFFSIPATLSSKSSRRSFIFVCTVCSAIVVTQT